MVCKKTCMIPHPVKRTKGYSAVQPLVVVTSPAYPVSHSTPWNTGETQSTEVQSLIAASELITIPVCDEPGSTHVTA